MTKRATFSQAEIARAIRAAESLGKVALWTPAGIAFVESGELPIALPPGDQAGSQSDLDRWFAENG
jgi:hypothetical protein